MSKNKHSRCTLKDSRNITSGDDDDENNIWQVKLLENVKNYWNWDVKKYF